MARLVERAEHQPAKCIVTGSWAEPERPLIDFEAWAPSVDPRVYLSPGLVHDVAVDLLDMVDGSVHQEALEVISQLKDELSTLAAERDEAVRRVEAIDVIESADFRARKKPGRKVAA